MTALAFAVALAALVPGWQATPGHHVEHTGCAFLRRDDGARLYVGLRGDRVLFRLVSPRDAAGVKLAADGPDVYVPRDVHVAVNTLVLLAPDLPIRATGEHRLTPARARGDGSADQGSGAISVRLAHMTEWRIP